MARARIGPGRTGRRRWYTVEAKTDVDGAYIITHEGWDRADAYRHLRGIERDGQDARMWSEGRAA